MFREIEDVNTLDIDKEAYLYLDTETIGLFGSIRVVTLYQTHWEEVAFIDTKVVDLMDLYQHIKDAIWVMHNGHYDLSVFRKELGSFVKPQWEDTFLAGRLEHYQLEKFSLDNMLRKVLGRNIYDDKKALQKSDWKGYLTHEQKMYASQDVYYLPKLWASCIKQKDKFVYILDKLTVNHFLVMQTKGMPVSEEALDRLYNEASEKVAKYEALLPKGFNCNSYKQVRALLDTEESDDLALARMIAVDGKEEAEWVRAQRKAKKQLSFLKKFETVEGRIKGHFAVGTVSGRSNCSEQNLQQLPSSLKSAFETENYLVYADFSNLELRTFAAVVGERTMSELFSKGVDVHTYAGSRLFHVNMEDVNKKQRTIAKIFNFSSLYGAGVRTRLSILLKLTGIYLEEDEGRKLSRMWLNAFKDVKPWQEENAKKWRAKQAGYTTLGRPYLAKLFTDQNNIQVQGSGAEVAKLALHYMSKKLDLTKLCNFVHDSYTWEVETLEEAKYYARVTAECMQEAWNELRVNFIDKSVDMPVVCSVAHNWAIAQEDDYEDQWVYKYELNGKGEVLHG